MGIVCIEYYLLVHLSSSLATPNHCRRPQVRVDTQIRLYWTHYEALAGQLLSLSVQERHPLLTSSPCIFGSERDGSEELS